MSTAHLKYNDPVVRIVAAGLWQCEIFAQVSLLLDYIHKGLPTFCFERMPKSVVDWPGWLCKINKRYGWHHQGSPIVWKELLIKGSKPYYIGGASEFLEYCHAYYDVDIYINPSKFEGLIKNFSQFKKKMKEDKEMVVKVKTKKTASIKYEKKLRRDYVICIYGASNQLTKALISLLLEMSVGTKTITRIYIYDQECTPEFMQTLEDQCMFIGTNVAGKVVKYVDKIGLALTNADLLIVLKYVAFKEEMSLGDWLQENRNAMEELAYMINASASRKMYILFANVGPSCFNATVLKSMITITKSNVVVATSDLGLNILHTLSDVAEVPVRNIFCPPVWGFVGINHLVDVQTTYHKYNSFDPYNRYTRVKNSTLQIGLLTPEIRTLEYLMYFDDSLWVKLAQSSDRFQAEENNDFMNKAIAVQHLVKIWLFDQNPDYIVNVGLSCDGSFGLSFKGCFSQPSRLMDKTWVPATDYLLPLDAQMKLPYLESMAEIFMNIGPGEFPKITEYYPCKCKKKMRYKKGQQKCLPNVP